MPHFTDANNREWSIKFDGLLLADLAAQHGINLGNIAGGDYVRLEQDSTVIVKAACVLCRDQLKTSGLTSQQFAASLVGESLESALEAIWGAAKLFFPAKRLSMLLSACEQLRQQQEQAAAMSMLNGMPPEVLDKVSEVLTGAMLQGMASTASQLSQPEKPSATGQAATLPCNASDSPDSAA